MSTRRLAVVLLALIAAAVGLVLLGGPVDEDERVRRVVQDIAEAAEHSNTHDILGLVSDRYYDDDGLDKKMLQAMLARQFLTRGRLLIVLGPIAVDRQDTTATASFEAVIAEGAEGLGLSADAQGFDVELELEEGEWRVVSHARHDVGSGL